MTYIHDCAAWPTLSWDSETLEAPLASLRHAQGKLLGRMGALGFEMRSRASVRTLIREVVGSSAIEGEHLAPEEVRSSLSRRLGLDTAGLPEPSRNVEGAVKMMLDATTNFRGALTQERLLSWHASLFPVGHGGMQALSVGAWRTPETDPMQVVSGPLGRERIHFRAPDAVRVSGEMDDFLSWFGNPSSTDPVLRAGLAHLRFVTIHPFEDGNGRVGRALCEMALAAADGQSERFYGFSAQVESERKQYYLELELAQRGTGDVTSWLVWFLACLGRAIANADQSLADVFVMAKVWQLFNEGPGNDRQRLVLRRLTDGFEGFLTTSKYAKLAKCSTDSALRDIRQLVGRGVLIPNPAGGRSSSYRLVGVES